MTFMLHGIDRRYDIQEMSHFINVHRIESMPQTLFYDVKIFTFSHAVLDASSLIYERNKLAGG